MNIAATSWPWGGLKDDRSAKKTRAIAGGRLMYEGAKVYKKDYGNGAVLSDVKCSGPRGDTYLLKIRFEKFDNLNISLYDDEVDFIHDA